MWAAETYAVARTTVPAGGVTSARRYVTRSGCTDPPAGRSQWACQSASRNEVVKPAAAAAGPHVPETFRARTVQR